MNCPSRTDEPLTDHPTWNQNPPFLAADLTTCEDLNGIANAREHRKGSDGAGSACGGSGREERDYFTIPPFQPDPGALPRGWRSFGPHPHEKGVIGGEGHSLSSTTATTATTAIPARSGSQPSLLWGWLAWAVSVVCCAALLSSLRIPEFLASLIPGASRDRGHGLDATALASNAVVGSHQFPTAPATTTKARRLGRRSTCPTNGVGSEADYNTPLHVGALLIILTVSFSACAFSLVASRLPRRLRVPPAFFFAVRHFGTGVLLATAFVHLLPTAFTLLGNPCLSSFWVDDYPAMPGAIALGGVFFVTLIEMVLQPARHLPVPAGSGGGRTGVGCMSAAVPPAVAAARQSSDGNDGDDAESPAEAEMEELRTGGNTAAAPPGRRSSSVRPANAAAAVVAQAGDRLGKSVAVTDEERGGAQAVVGGHVQLTPMQQHQKDIMQCMMLEVGILFHSVFIGMTLSVSVGHEFVILLIAIAFHQTFEGLALGSRIAAISWPEKSWQPWLMSLAYGCTTPVGQAIGIATHMLYNPQSEFGLVLVGTMNAISSGLLVFASLIELLSEDFLSDESWRVLRGRRRVYACLLVLLGAIGMSLVGAWA